MNDIKWVNCAKGIGIFLVVYGHMQRGVFRADLGMNEELFNYLDTFIYSFHMPLFFILSGLFFLSSIEKYKFKSFISIKLQTLLYPFVVWSLIQGGIQYFMNGATNSTVGVGEVLNMFSTPQQQMWFLYALFCIMVFFAILWRLRILNIQVVILLLLVAKLAGLDAGMVKVVKYVILYGVYFAIGIYLGMQIKTSNGQQATLKMPSSKLTFVCTAVFVILFSVLYVNGSINRIFDFILALFGSFVVLGISFNLSGKVRDYSAIIGVASFFIYLLHILLGTGARIVLTKIGFSEPYSLLLIIVTVIGLLLPLVVVDVMKRLNLMFFFFPPKLKRQKVLKTPA